MFGLSAFFRLSEEELERVIDRVLSSERVEAFVERLVLKVIDLLFERLRAGTRGLDEEREGNGKL